MTDQIPADKVREIIAAHRDGASRRAGVILAALEALLPTPPRPTLADMTEDERFNAVGMWADVDGFHPYRAVIGDTPAPKVPVFRPSAGSLDWVHPEDVTPLPELGRAWSPGGSPTGTPAPAPALPEGWRLADHQKRGRVIVTNPTPNRNGRVHFVIPADDPEGYGWNVCDPDKLTYLDQGAEDVPPVKVGDVIESADDPRVAALPDGTILVDRDDDAVIKWGGEWSGAGYIPNESQGGKFGPWKVIHAGQEADR